MTDERTRTSDDVPRRQKAPYTKPALEEYGRIADITRHVGNASPNPDPPPHTGFVFTTR
jgi:hypothetical protein